MLTDQRRDDHETSVSLMLKRKGTINVDKHHVTEPDASWWTYISGTYIQYQETDRILRYLHLS